MCTRIQNSSPYGAGGDRFIPSRSTTNFDSPCIKSQRSQKPYKKNQLSQTKKEWQRLLDEHFFHGDKRVLSYHNKAQAAIKAYEISSQNNNAKTSMLNKSPTRYIPQKPNRILPAPNILDNYYLKLVDWSANNVIAVALDSGVHLHNLDTNKKEQLLELEDAYVSSIAWMQEKPYLAVGTSHGTTEIYDCIQMKRLRKMNGHTIRVGSMSWNSNILSTGCRKGKVVHHDVTQREHAVSVVKAHESEVCGLNWSLDGKMLASGGNDDMLHIWPMVKGQNQNPIYSMNQHRAAVKALAWCPWSSNILASGGGTKDKCIRFWDCNTGLCLKTVDTDSQVSSLLWSSTCKEIVSSHGFTKNQLMIWKYPRMTKVADLTGHTDRVLNLALSPDGTTVLSAGAEGVMRFWKCFQCDQHQTMSKLMFNIR